MRKLIWKEKPYNKKSENFDSFENLTELMEVDTVTAPVASLGGLDDAQPLTAEQLLTIID